MGTSALACAGIRFEIVPGISAAIGVPAFAGIPVTDRRYAASFTVVTGHSRHAVDRETNWEALAQAGGTIVVLMGVAHRAGIAAPCQDVENDVARVELGAERLGTGRLDCTEPIGQYRAEDINHLPMAVIDRSQFATNALDCSRQQPVLKGCAVAQRSRLARQDRHIMPGIVNLPRRLVVTTVPSPWAAQRPHEVAKLGTTRCVKANVRFAPSGPDTATGAARSELS